MTREWRPGDVALVLTGVNRGRVGYVTANVGESYCVPLALPDGEEEGGIAVLAYGSGPEHLRPLVVIDPEDREQILRVVAALRSHGWTADETGMTRTEQALASLLEPPNPPEPQGLGAVIETVNGELYVRDKTTTTVAHWKRARGEDGSKRYRYRTLRIARILSDGVTS